VSEIDPGPPRKVSTARVEFPDAVNARSSTRTAM
jgi:hypothetical protein